MGKENGMTVKKDRNYWLAFFGCLACTAMTLLSSSWSWEKIRYLVSSDINVVLWLFVAWLFDDK
jgi:hypothetical protein